MSNNNIHYDYCRCCGVWTEVNLLDVERVCDNCYRVYCPYQPCKSEAPTASLSNEL